MISAGISKCTRMPSTMIKSKKVSNDGVILKLARTFSNLFKDFF